MPIDKLSGIISSKEKDIIIPDGFVHDLILNQVLKDFDPNRPFEVSNLRSSFMSDQFLWALSAPWCRKIFKS